MTTQREFCSKCGIVVTADEAFCPECGTETKSRSLLKFNWEPKEQRHPPAPPDFFGQKVIPKAQSVQRQESAPTMSKSPSSTIATAGIIIIATLLAFSFWFGFAIGAFAAMSPPEPERIGFDLYVLGDYLTGARVVWAALLAGMATVVTWAVALAIADQ